MGAALSAAPKFVNTYTALKPGLSAQDEFWAQVPLFQCLPTSLHPKLTACSQPCTFDAGERIMEQGEPGSEFFVIKKGEAQVIVDGNICASVGPGDYFGEVALLNTLPRTATIQATSTLYTLKIQRSDFQELGLHEQLTFPSKDRVPSRHKMMAMGAAQSEKPKLDIMTRLRSEGTQMVSSKSIELRRSEASRVYYVSNCKALWSIITERLNITAFFFVPMGLFCKYNEYSSGIVFASNFCAIIPLASILGAATESLAAHTGQLIGGLLNATLGNAVEMIMCVQAVKAGLVRVVQGNLLGSILSNLLLVLGMSIFASGMVRRTQTFNQQGAASNMTCLLVASISICLPTVFHSVSEVGDSDNVLTISRISAVFLMAVYGMFLYFMLKTHADLFEDEGEEDDDEADLSQVFCVSLLFVTTVVVFLCSQCLVDSIEDVSSSYGLSKAFIGVILLPIVGNAAEHATAVSCAHKGMMDLALGVAVGSSTQIALFVVPCAIMCGWYYDVPMDLSFSLFEMTCQMLTVFLVSQVLSHGQTNWLHGAMLMTVYVFIATQCLFIIEPDDI